MILLLWITYFILLLLHSRLVPSLIKRLRILIVCAHGPPVDVVKGAISFTRVLMSVANNVYFIVRCVYFLQFCETLFNVLGHINL